MPNVVCGVGVGVVNVGFEKASQIQICLSRLLSMIVEFSSPLTADKLLQCFMHGDLIKNGVFCFSLAETKSWVYCQNPSVCSLK